MREHGRYRQGGDGDGEREDSQHCHVGTAFLRLEIGARATERARLFVLLATQREASIR